jgi:hypothetical protein
LGAAFAALTASGAQAAPSTPAPAMAWVIQPADAACRTELELTGKSGAILPVTLLSDGERTVLRFPKADLPERAFLPIRVDQKPYSNLMLRAEDPSVGELVLSSETLAALRKGATLQVAWLSDEPVGASLAGSDQAIPDLVTCGAQAAALERTRRAAESEARAAAEAREQALANAQLEAVRAQQAAAEAERQRVLEAAERERAEQDAERQRVAYEDARRQRAEAEAERQRAYEDALRRYGYDDPRAVAPAPQPWPPEPRYPYPRRY